MYHFKCASSGVLLNFDIFRDPIYYCYHLLIQHSHVLLATVISVFLFKLCIIHIYFPVLSQQLSWCMMALSLCCLTYYNIPKDLHYTDFVVQWCKHWHLSIKFSGFQL